MFGGDIICQSEIGKGSNFIFIVELGEFNYKNGESVTQMNRLLNPMKRKYKKICLKTSIKKNLSKDEESEDDESEIDFADQLEKIQLEK